MIKFKPFAMIKAAIEDPIEFMKRFTSAGPYRVWCHAQTTWDLEKHLEALEEVEMYEVCAVARDVIQAKKGALALAQNNNETTIYPTRNTSDSKE